MNFHRDVADTKADAAVAAEEHAARALTPATTTVGG